MLKECSNTHTHTHTHAHTHTHTHMFIQKLHLTALNAFEMISS